ncbi:MAG: phosphoglycerate kinase [Candidatus Komeilibacteria bacterium RIFOXYC1_FULL_37_11]|uniref:Phosphoglycerate kinase n=1 Tax=Candidatus Komeilibacteria bacterium RIFOXYC1_FULL_37_11 TaxID=1798555 RepID=A0A1G2BZG5_9BACT|nr:MAG: phosphoglycerate kinase [Candidatus Komeilibacteria bacterium RIFOXYC1_FULL_37_11]OGY95836.1 MAG: phosphoglycerate kinase [Candidatus Komeilibacteria bacterium RIFOXYD1_FULL_37_29]
MTLKVINQIKNLDNKRVLLRLDLNVPFSDGQVDKEDDKRVQTALPTIKYLLSKKAKVIIVAHLGRPKDKVVPSLSMSPISVYLSKVLKKKVTFWPGNFRDYLEESFKIKPGSVVMIENIRFEPGEKKNSKELARDLSRLADIYVDDAFGNIHRQDASMHAICDFLPAYAGLLVAEEVKHLSNIYKVKKGLVYIFGGAKAETKIKLIKKVMTKAEAILVGGPLASTLLKSAGYNVGRSLVDDDYVKLGQTLLKSKVAMPLDVCVAASPQAKKYRVLTVDKVSKNDMILDIGPATVDRYIKILKTAKLVIWNGPFGYFENPIYMGGSRKIMQALAKSKVKVILGGGETVGLAEKLKLADKFDFISTGGGAMLTFLGGEKMPSLDRLKK